MIKTIMKKISNSIFNLIPNVSFLIPLKIFVLKIGYVKINSKNTLILSSFYKDSSINLTIAHDVFINKLCFFEGRRNINLFNNIQIAPNIIVASGSVVTKNFNNCVCGGVPAKIIKEYNV